MNYFLNQTVHKYSNILLEIIEFNSVHVLLITIVGGTALTFISYQIYLNFIKKSCISFLFNSLNKINTLMLFLLSILVLLFYSNFFSEGIPSVLCDSSVPAADPAEDLNYRTSKSDSPKWGSLALVGVSTYALTKMGVPVTWAALLSLLVFLVPEATSSVAPIELPRVNETIIIDPNSLPSYSAIGEGKTTGVLFGNAGVAALVHLHRNAMVSFFVLSGIREFTDWPVAPAILLTWFIFTIFNQWENINATGFACSAKDTEQATSETPSNTTSKASDVTANFIIIPSPIGDLNNQSIEKQKAEFREKRRISEEAIKKQKTLNLTEVDEDLPPAETAQDRLKYKAAEIIVISQRTYVREHPLEYNNNADPSSEIKAMTEDEKFQQVLLTRIQHQIQDDPVLSKLPASEQELLGRNIQQMLHKERHGRFFFETLPDNIREQRLQNADPALIELLRQGYETFTGDNKKK